MSLESGTFQAHKNIENVALWANNSLQMATFGENVRRLREAKGLQARQLADQVDVAPSVVSAWENDRKGLPETPTLFKLAKALDVGVEELLEGVDADYETQRQIRLKVSLTKLRSSTDKLGSLIPAIESGLLPKEFAYALLDDFESKLRALKSAAQETAAPSNDERPETQAATRLAQIYLDLTPQSRRLLNEMAELLLASQQQPAPAPSPGEISENEDSTDAGSKHIRKARGA